MIPQENGIIVSPTEPIKNRRKVWIRKGIDVEEAIFVKNENGNYEEFIKKENDIITIKNNNGTAILFPDGTMMCTKIVYFQKVSINIAVGALYRSESLGLGNWAYEFIENPIMLEASLVNGWAAWLYQYTNAGPISAGDVIIMRPTNSSTSESNKFTVYAIAIGRWR